MRADAGRSTDLKRTDSTNDRLPAKAGKLGNGNHPMTRTIHREFDSLRIEGGIFPGEFSTCASSSSKGRAAQTMACIAP